MLDAVSLSMVGKSDKEIAFSSPNCAFSASIMDSYSDSFTT